MVAFKPQPPLGSQSAIDPLQSVRHRWADLNGKRFVTSRDLTKGCASRSRSDGMYCLTRESAAHSPVGPEEFEASLKRRGKAARGLAQDLLTEVPMLYGSPGQMEAEGDPGIVLARIHQEELKRRNGGGVSCHSRSRAELPYERATGALAILLMLLLVFLG